MAEFESDTREALAMIEVKPVLKLLSHVRVQMLNILSKLMLTLKLPQAVFEPETESIRPAVITSVYGHS
jgi:hypothetical protein